MDVTFEVNLHYLGVPLPQFRLDYISRRYHIQLATFMLILIDFTAGPIIFQLHMQERRVDVSVSCELLHAIVNDRLIAADPLHENPRDI